MNYFAYGSNLLNARLLRRVPSARLLGIGRLHGHCLRFHLRAEDGSGKCNAAPVAEAGQMVWGAVYRIDAAEKPLLDAAESLGHYYDIAQVRIESETAGWEAFTYRAVSRWIDEAAIPYHWYKHFVLAGARQKALPEAYADAIATMLACADPDPDRRRFNHRILLEDDGDRFLD